MTTPRPVVARRAFLGGTAAATLGALLTACTTEQADAASPNEIDIGFCQDMAFHHEQALAMCQRVLGTDTGSQVQTAAADILQNQSYERGMMHTWLQSWGEGTAPPSTVMGWMGMEMAADMMPGLATDEEMRELALAEGLEKGRMFLELMRTHHVGGVHMAEAATGAATAPVRQIGAQAALVQAYEIEIFDELLATSYA